MKILSFLSIGFLILFGIGCAKKSPPESLEIMNPPATPPATQPMEPGPTAAPETSESQPKKEGIFEKAGRKMDAGLKKAGEKTGEGLQKMGEKIKSTTD